MDNEKIKELAQSCAEACLERYASMQDSEIAKEYSDVMEAAIRTILETHCIVPKTTIDKHYTEMAKDYAMYLDPDNKANREMIEVDSLGFLNWVMEKYCIVEKEKIKALYSKMELDGNHVDSDNDWAVYEAMDELEKIFGEELFNGTEK